MDPSSGTETSEPEKGQEVVAHPASSGNFQRSHLIVSLEAETHTQTPAKHPSSN